MDQDGDQGRDRAAARPGSRWAPWVARYAVALLVFLALDMVWLTTIAQGLYRDQLGDLLRDPPNVLAAVVFYALFVAGLVFFVVEPAIRADSLRRALVTGAFFGVVTYATWDLTNLSVLADFPVAIVPIDLAWGGFVSASVAGATVVLARRFPAWAR